MKDYFLIIFLIVALIGYTFLLGALCTWLFCIAFGLTFTWGRAFVVWLIFSLATGGIKIAIKK